MALPVYTNDQIANQLTTGFWSFVGAPPARWNIATGGSLSVNITALTAGGQFFAQAALKTWSESTGINFVYTTGPAQITFDDADPNSAYEFHTIFNGFITSASINISTNWIAGDLGNLNSYSYQTYLHEIGHALGLGHAGNYDGAATYGVDNQYLNDSWQASVMSYFSRDENTYVNADFAFVMTPMVADMNAVNSLYGAATTTRTGNTTYGFNSNAGNVIFDATQFPNVSYTIVDNGGTDTLDYSGFTQNQSIDLNAEAFSSIGGVVGNVTIVRGSTIENAIGGSGADTLIGNLAANALTGGAGADTISGGAGNDTLRGGLGNDTVRGGTGDDVVNTGGGDDVLYGGGGNDTLTGGLGNDNLTGGLGDDILYGGAGNDMLTGGADADVFVFADLAFGADQIADFQDSVDHLSFSANVAGSFADFIITGNGTTNVTVTHGADSITVASAAAFTLAADDFIFV